MLNILSSTDEFADALEVSLLSRSQRVLFVSRFIALIKSYEVSYWYLSLLYWSLTTCVSVGGVVLTALTSLRTGMGSNEIIDYMTIGVSIAVTLANVFLHVGNNVQKRYTHTTTVIERLKREGWMMLGKCGGYEQLSTDEGFTRFCCEIERISDNAVSQYVSNLPNGVSRASRTSNDTIVDELLSSGISIHAAGASVDVSTAESTAAAASSLDSPVVAIDV